MADNSVKLKIDGDASGLLKAVKAAMAQIEQESKKVKLSPEAEKASPKNAPGAPGSETFQRALQATRNQEKKQKDEQQALQIANSALDNKKRKLEDISRQEVASIGNAKQLAHLAEQKAKAEREYQQLLVTRKRLESTGGIAAGRGGGGGGAAGLAGGSAGDFNMGKGGITSLAGVAGALGVPGMILGTAATAIAGIKAAESARAFFAESELRTRTKEATAFQTQGQGGQLLQSFINGGANEEQMYGEQRSQAAGIAQKTVQGRYAAIPGLEKIPGGIGFGMMGMKGILGEEGLGALEHGRFAQAGRSFLGRIGFTSQQKEFEANKNVEQSQEQAAQFEALKAGPGGALRTTIADKYLKDWRRNLDFQRQTGQSEGGFRNFLTDVNRAGFTDEQAMGTSSAIMGAGGSTRASRENAGFALQMGRQFDLTNAGQAIGAISGQLGSGQMSKEALIKIQAEGTMIGVNQADFVEENRKFVEMASNVINQSNVTSSSGVDQLVDTFGKFMSNRTTTGMEAGRSAYEAYQRQSNTQTGPSAVMRAAGMIKDPALKTLSGESQASLFTMSQSDVNVDNQGLQSMANENPAIVAAAKRAGVSPVQYLVNQYHGIQDKSMFQRKNTDQSISKLRDAYSSKTLRSANDIPRLEGEALNLMRLEPAAQSLDEKGKMELVRAMAKGDTTAADRLLDQKKIQTAAEGNEARRPGDEMNKQQAEASRMANELFVSIQKSIVPAAEATQKFTADINALVSAMRGGDLKQINNAINRMNTNNPGFLSPQTQPSAGPPVNGGGVPAAPGH